MEFEFLVEGRSDAAVLERLLPKILGPKGLRHAWKIHPHQGKGRLPEDLEEKPHPWNNTLLHRLPAKLRAYGRSMRRGQAVVVLLDVDKDDCRRLKRELVRVLEAVRRPPPTLIRIAVEETEAWLLGDAEAVFAAYPKADRRRYETYEQDSVCGTWEVLAEVVHPGGVKALRAEGRRAHLFAKNAWARKISPFMDPEKNRSPSFQVFREGLLRLAESDR